MDTINQYLTGVDAELFSCSKLVIHEHYVTIISYGIAPPSEGTLVSILQNK